MREWAAPKTRRSWEAWGARRGAVALLAALLLAAFAVSAIGFSGLFPRPSAGPAPLLVRPQWMAGSDISRLPAAAVVTAAPQAGAIYSCGARFTGSGAIGAGPWLRPDGTFDLSAKPTVSGAVSWPGRFAISREGDARLLAGNGLPSHSTGSYPIARTDPAYNFDRNPNAIREAPLALTLPATPSIAPQPTCLPLGPIGVLRTGAALFNALDAAGRDAVAYELQDGCFGHPAPGGAYHYHSLSPCVVDVGERAGVHSPLVGYAFDGFGIYGPHGEGGIVLDTAALDDCHGHTHEVEWDGQPLELYHYHATWSYPYTLGCFRGTPATGPLR